MPELIEVEQYRRLAATVVGRRISRVSTPDPWYVKGGIRPASIARSLRGQVVVAARRHGKLLVLDTSGPPLGIRFGMTGRLLVDGVAAITELEYGSAREEPRWDRFGLCFEAGGSLAVRDPRRLGGVELEPGENALGPDASAITVAQLRRALAGHAALKARLLDQSRVAGIGNLICDEALWRAGLDPARPADSLDARELRRLQRTLVRTVADLTTRGGSHLGDLQPHRVAGGCCPRDGAALVRRTIGGRTTFSCPLHQC